MKPFSFETSIRDSDDVCHVAVMIIKRLIVVGHDPDYNLVQQFSHEIMQVIEDIQEPLRPKRDAQDEEENPNADETVRFHELGPKYENKLDEMTAKIEQIRNSGDETDLPEALAKAKIYHAVLEEISLKIKLHLKRALNLLLILLKQCRANVNDVNLLTMSLQIVKPGLQAVHDTDIQILALECVGLCTLLDIEIFNNYSPIFGALIDDALDSVGSNILDLPETIMAVRSVIDGLIVHGSTPKT